MRISKEPEVRKQEIINTAMKVFSDKGYEATTMKDIARQMNVASGLCYHYFTNKQKLYEEAVKQYARTSSSIFIHIFKQTGLSLEECLNELGRVWMDAQKNGSFAYEAFFHEKGNELFHRQLDMAMFHEIMPYVTAYLDELKVRREICVKDTKIAARFILNGQTAVINDDSLPMMERFLLLKELIGKVLK